MFRRVSKTEFLSFSRVPTVLATFLLTTSFLLMVFRLHPVVEELRRFLYYWFSPATPLVLLPKKEISHLQNRLHDLILLDQENLALKEKLKEQSQLEIKYEESLSEISRLNSLLELKNSLEHKTMAAKVLSKESRNWNQTLLIDKGLNEGVEAGMVVLGVERALGDLAGIRSGVIGRVVLLGPNSAQVLLLTDPQSYVSCKVLRTQEEGLLKGNSSNLTLDYLEPNSDLRLSDTVVTSGMGGVFPVGFMLGHVVEVSTTQSGFKRAMVQPSVSIAKIKEVILLSK